MTNNLKYYLIEACRRLEVPDMLDISSGEETLYQWYLNLLNDDMKEAIEKSWPQKYLNTIHKEIMRLEFEKAEYEAEEELDV